MRQADEGLRHCPVCGGDPPTGFRDFSTWAFDLLPGKVGFTDLDAVLERNGRFLCIEFKPNGTWVPKGQWLVFQALIAQGWDVWVVAPLSGDRDRVMVRYGDGTEVTMTLENLRADIVEWWGE